MLCRPAVYNGWLSERRQWAANRKDSEWLLCDDVRPPCLVFSIGVGNFWQFDLAAAERGCEVHSFDPTPELKQQHARNIAAYHMFNLTNMHFHFLGLGGPSSANITSSYGKQKLGPLHHLDQLIATYAQGRPIDVVKVDCEGCEWESLAHLATAAPRALCSVRFLQFELHMSAALHFRSGREAGYSDCFGRHERRWMEH